MAIFEAWVFEDDGALVKFDNGCSLQLSSCGAVFRGCSSTNDVKNNSLVRSIETQQLCQFATTAWKDMVKQALDFRNKFASHPYLGHNLSETATASKECRVLSPTTCTWSGEKIVNNEDKSTSLTSKEQNAIVTILACKQIFIMNFLCQIAIEKQNGSEQAEKPAYSWVKQIHSPTSFHSQCFLYPMSVLSGETMSGNYEGLTSTGPYDLPRSLPQKCKKPHLHRWRSYWNADMIGSSEFLDRELVKVFYSENVVYRFYYERFLMAEALLSDGSVMRSTGPSHLYFKHWIYNSETGSVKENVYSAKAPPLNEPTNSIPKILNTVNRYLKYLSVCWKSHLTYSPCCWKNDNDSLLLDAESEREFSMYIRDHGSFKIYSNGKIRIVFCDGAIMGFYDPSDRANNIRSEAKYDFLEMSSEKEIATLVGDTTFTIILPNGVSYKSTFDRPSGSYNRYVQMALSFLKWKHHQAEKDDENLSRVYEELEKLKRFTASDSKREKQSVKVTPSIDTCKRNASDLQDVVKESSKLAAPPLLEVRNIGDYLNDTRKAVGEIGFTKL